MLSKNLNLVLQRAWLSTNRVSESTAYYLLSGHVQSRGYRLPQEDPLQPPLRFNIPKQDLDPQKNLDYKLTPLDDPAQSGDLHSSTLTQDKFDTSWKTKETGGSNSLSQYEHIGETDSRFPISKHNKDKTTGTPLSHNLDIVTKQMPAESKNPLVVDNPTESENRPVKTFEDEAVKGRNDRIHQEQPKREEYVIENNEQTKGGGSDVRKVLETNERKYDESSGGNNTIETTEDGECVQMKDRSTGDKQFNPKVTSSADAGNCQALIFDKPKVVSPTPNKKSIRTSRTKEIYSSVPIPLQSTLNYVIFQTAELTQNCGLYGTKMRPSTKNLKWNQEEVTEEVTKTSYRPRLKDEPYEMDMEDMSLEHIVYASPNSLSQRLMMMKNHTSFHDIGSSSNALVNEETSESQHTDFQGNPSEPEFLAIDLQHKNRAESKHKDDNQTTSQNLTEPRKKETELGENEPNLQSIQTDPDSPGNNEEHLIRKNHQQYLRTLEVHQPGAYRSTSMLPMPTNRRGKVSGGNMGQNQRLPTCQEQDLTEKISEIERSKHKSPMRITVYDNWKTVVPHRIDQKAIMDYYAKKSNFSTKPRSNGMKRHKVGPSSKVEQQKNPMNTDKWDESVRNGNIQQKTASAKNLQSTLSDDVVVMDKAPKWQRMQQIDRDNTCKKSDTATETGSVVEVTGAWKVNKKLLELATAAPKKIGGSSRICLGSTGWFVEHCSTDKTDKLDGKNIQKERDEGSVKCVGMDAADKSELQNIAVEIQNISEQQTNTCKVDTLVKTRDELHHGSLDCQDKEIEEILPTIEQLQTKTTRHCTSVVGWNTKDDVEKGTQTVVKLVKNIRPATGHNSDEGTECTTQRKSEEKVRSTGAQNYISRIRPSKEKEEVSPLLNKDAIEEMFDGTNQQDKLQITKASFLPTFVTNRLSDNTTNTAEVFQIPTLTSLQNPTGSQDLTRAVEKTAQNKVPQKSFKPIHPDGMAKVKCKAAGAVNERSEASEPKESIPVQVHLLEEGSKADAKGSAETQTKKLDAVNRELFGVSECDDVQLDTFKMEKLNAFAAVAEASLGVDATNTMADKSNDVDPFESVPGPAVLRTMSSVWQYLPNVTNQAIVSSLIWLFQRDLNPQSRPFRALFNTYGPVVRLQGPVGGEIILVHRPDHVQAVFDQDGKHPLRCSFDSLERFRVQKQPNNKGRDSLVEIFQRKQHPLKQPPDGPMRSDPEKQHQQIQDLASQFVKRIGAARNRRGEVEKDLMEDISKWSLECLSSATLGTSFNLLSTNQGALSPEAEQLLQSLTDASQSLYKCESGFQAWRFFNTPSSKKLRESCQVLDSILLKNTQLVKDDPGRGNKNGTSLVQNLLVKDGMSERDIASSLLDFFLIGVSTTSSALAFLLYQLSKHQTIQRRVFNEVLQVLPHKDSTLDLNHLPHLLPYLRACLYESLRLNLPIPILTRILSRDICLSKYKIPKGTFVVMAAQYSCLKEENFENAMAFNPDRWLGQSDTAGLQDPCAALLCGHGLKGCLAEDQLLTCVAKILRNFRLEHNYGDVGRTKNIISLPDTPLRLSFEDRVN